MVNATTAPLDTVNTTLEDYAGRGVFRSFSQGKTRAGKTEFKLLWHRQKTFILIFDSEKETLRFRLVLPNVPADSEMYASLKELLSNRRTAKDRPHRDVDPEKATIRPHNRGGAVSLGIQVMDGDFDYGTRKLINLVNEIFLGFLVDGPYYEYMVENFDLNVDEE